MSSMLSAAVVGNGKFNQYIGNWNTSQVTLMNSMFNEQVEFSQDLSTKIVTVNGVTYTAWNTANVLNMSFMFSGTTALGGLGKFNGNICNWNTSQVTNMSRMFLQKNKFNQDISTKVVTVGASTYTAWDTKNVLDMQFMLYVSQPGGVSYGEFNQNIGNWNTSKVTSLYATFYNQVNFNQDLSTKAVTVNGVTYTAWDTLNVTTMAYTFSRYTVDGPLSQFNGNISNWNTTKVNTLRTMFQLQQIFNQDISTKTVTVNGSTYTAWNTGIVTDLAYTFCNTNAFNSSIDNWNVSNVTTLLSTFSGAIKFNQPLNSWNTVKVNSMGGTFTYAYEFNQSISNWKANIVTTFIDGTYGFMGGKTFNDYSSANYDALLIGWASRPVLANKSIDFGSIKYSSAALSARSVLTSSPNFWTIVDGGLAA